MGEENRKGEGESRGPHGRKGKEQGQKGRVEGPGYRRGRSWSEGGGARVREGCGGAGRGEERLEGEERGEGRGGGHGVGGGRMRKRGEMGAKRKK